ncbi:MAG: hypothetical protein U9P36_07910 [Thermodesulfobacteriota bacterium]|nr:hypothetical protein [Thermodesulfobacteriota bacterium]
MMMHLALHHHGLCCIPSLEGILSFQGSYNNLNTQQLKETTMINKLHIVLSGLLLLALVGCGQDEVETTADKVEDSLHNAVETTKEAAHDISVATKEAAHDAAVATEEAVHDVKNATK